MSSFQIPPPSSPPIFFHSPSSNPPPKRSHQLLAAATLPKTPIYLLADLLVGPPRFVASQTEVRAPAAPYTC